MTATDGESSPAPAASPIAAFARLYVVMLLSFFGAKLLFNLGAMGWIDLRPAALSEFLLVPLVQSLMFWLITRRRHRPAG